jgi:hypothetical protein
MVMIMNSLRPIDVRRAILAVLIRAGGGPLDVADIVARVGDEEGVDLALTQATSAHQPVSDVMRHQVRVGRATAERRGRYRLVLPEFSESTIWRCLHWRRVAAQSQRRYLADRAPTGAMGRSLPLHSVRSLTTH